MSLKFDLHSHSTVSDGSLSPQALLHAAKQANIDVLALTDHDCTGGIQAAAKHAADLDIHFVAGVEISVTWRSVTIHVLGLGIQPENEALQAGLATLLEFRHWRAAEIARKLEKAGIPDALAGARAQASGSLLSRTHFAHFLVKHGHAKDVRQVFKHFLVRGKPGHVAGQWATLEQAVAWIDAAGGQAVIAHPARYHMTNAKMEQLLTEFRDAGGVGLEVVSSAHNSSDCRRMALLAQKHHLLASCGSDFHSPDAPWAQLGRIAPLPEICTPIWERWPPFSN